MKYPIYLSLLMIVVTSSCATVSRPKAEAVDGACIHPAVNGGMPFPIPETIKYDGINLIVDINDEENEGILTGAACAFSRKKQK